MPKTIPVIFSGDTSIKNEERIAYTNFVNEVLAGLRQEISWDGGHIKVISKNGVNQNVTYISSNTDLQTQINALLSISPFKY